jgi:hypothetical protein
VLVMPEFRRGAGDGDKVAPLAVEPFFGQVRIGERDWFNTIRQR